MHSGRFHHLSEHLDLNIEKTSNDKYLEYTADIAISKRIDCVAYFLEIIKLI